MKLIRLALLTLPLIVFSFTHAQTTTGVPVAKPGRGVSSLNSHPYNPDSKDEKQLEMQREEVRPVEEEAESKDSENNYYEEE